MEHPTPCVCGEIVDLDEMVAIEKPLPGGQNLVCETCWCDACQGTGDCPTCNGYGECDECGATCQKCGSDKGCRSCGGRGYSTARDSE